MDAKAPLYLFSAADIARALGVRPQTVTRRAQEAGIGRHISGRWVFTSAEKEQISGLVQKKPGCPKFIPGNDLWKRRKKLPGKRKKQVQNLLHADE